VSPLDDPLELLLEPPLELLLVLAPELLLELLFPASSPGFVAGGDELLLQAMAPATANVAILATPNRFVRLKIIIMKASMSRVLFPDNRRSS
jgi:hypothetical protein